MAVASGRLAAPAAYVPAPRWRSRPMQVAGIVLLILLGYALLGGDYGWPVSLTWQELPERLDDAQTWLLEERTAENPNIVFAIFDGFRALAVQTTVRDAVPVVAATDRPVRAIEDGRVVGVVDREAVLGAMAEGPEAASGGS